MCSGVLPEKILRSSRYHFFILMMVYAIQGPFVIHARLGRRPSSLPRREEGRRPSRAWMARVHFAKFGRLYRAVCESWGDGGWRSPRENFELWRSSRYHFLILIIVLAIYLQGHISPNLPAYAKEQVKVGVTGGSGSSP